MTITVETIVKLMESLPESSQERVLEHLREYISDMGDEQQWDDQFRRSESKLVAAARRAREEIQEGVATPLDHDRL
jgi:hypothetical protein